MTPILAYLLIIAGALLYCATAGAAAVPELVAALAFAPVGVTLLSPRGLPYIELGGDRAWMTRTIGEFVCSFQWIDLGEDDGPSACMVLYAANRQVDPATYVIPQRNAHAFARPDGHPTPHALGAAFKAVIELGMFPAHDTVASLIDIIVEGIPDLIRMPSDQPTDLTVARTLLGIEARAAVNGRTIHEEVL